MIKNMIYKYLGQLGESSLSKGKTNVYLFWFIGVNLAQKH